ncbi:MAG: TonB-dependent receptor [Acidobacteriota bacterium]
MPRPNTPFSPRPRLTHLASLLALIPACGWAGSAAGEAELPEIVVAAPQAAGGLPRNLSANSSGYSAQEISEQVNVINTEDIVKYSPDTMTRKRYVGDRNAIIETRTASVTSSARSLVYADGFLLSNLLGNSFNYPPRWGMVSPEEIKRVDFFFGPYSAAYAGNSLGTTVIMTTRMPQQFEGSGKAQWFQEDFSLYGHSASFSGNNVQASVGNKVGGLSWLLGMNQLNSQGHPMQYAVAEGPGQTHTSGTAVTGFAQDTNLLGARRLILGETSRDTTHQKTFKLKLAYDFTPTLKGRYWLSSWQNDSFNGATSYLHDATGNTVTSGRIYDGVSKDYTIASNAFSQNVWAQTHWMNALSLKSTLSPHTDWELNATWYRIGEDKQHTSLPDGRCGTGTTTPGSSVGTCTTTGVGRATKYFGTEVQNPYGDGWRTLDWRWNVRPQAADGQHDISAGYHYDQYQLDSRSYLTNAGATGDNWRYATPAALLSASRGKTETQAVYAQDAWRLAPNWMLTPGLRAEVWKAFDGSNSAIVANGTKTQNELSTAPYAPRTQSLALSPKLALQRATDDNWIYRAAFGRAYRFPTVTELFQSLTTGASISVNNPDLKPESTNSAELTAEKSLDNGALRLSLFNENLHNALYSQTTTVDGSNVTAITNIDHVRTQGVTWALQQTDVGVKGLDMNASLTYARARILRNRIAPATEGKVYPGVPDWRATWVGTYRPSDKWAITLAARYSGDQSNRPDNLDINRDTYTSNSAYLVVDTRVTWTLDKQVKLALGIDNLNNETYYAYHPMPQRTVHAELQARF